jgi:hypothetical protein
MKPDNLITFCNESTCTQCNFAVCNECFDLLIDKNKFKCSICKTVRNIDPYINSDKYLSKIILNNVNYEIFIRSSCLTFENKYTSQKFIVDHDNYFITSKYNIESLIQRNIEEEWIFNSYKFIYDGKYIRLMTLNSNISFEIKYFLLSTTKFYILYSIFGKEMRIEGDFFENNVCLISDTIINNYEPIKNIERCIDNIDNNNINILNEVYTFYKKYNLSLSK